jgi:hypothetical protein
MLRRLVSACIAGLPDNLRDNAMKNIKRTLAVLSIYFLLALSVVVNATEIINDVTGNQSAVDAACVAPIPFFNGEDCSYNETDPTGFAPGPGVWAGPTVAAWYYLPGQSPGVDSPPSAGDPADELSLTGTITIDDKDSVDCADDTITGEVILGAGTRAFGGGQGAFGEESWGDGDIKFPWAETGVDTGAANVGGGCDYVIASAGYPPRIEEAAAPNRLYPVNASSFVGFYVAPSPVGIAFVTEGNAGVQIEVTVGAGWSCVQNGVGAACDEGAGLNLGGAHFKGTREILETVLFSISTNGAGNITNGEMYANNESKIFNVAPNPYNSWDGTRWVVTGQCTDCSLVSPDFYSVLVDSANNILDIGANDSDSLIDPTAVTVTQAPDQAGTAIINGSPGDIKLITADYTPAAAFQGTETFQYTADDNDSLPATATVTIEVVPDTIPVAGDLNMDLDTVGVDPATLTGQIDALVAPNDPGNNGTVDNVTAPANGNGVSSTDGTNVIYEPNGSFFSGTDNFDYTIIDDQSDEDTGTVTVNIADASPTASGGSGVTDQGVAVDIPISVTPGNGSLAQHSASISADAANGTCTLNAAVDILTYTPDAEFFGDNACTYTVMDGDGSTADGVVTITVNEVDDVVIKLPGSNALGPWTLALLLLGLPLVRRRRKA